MSSTYPSASKKKTQKNLSAEVTPQTNDRRISRVNFRIFKAPQIIPIDNQVGEPVDHITS
jgi:hypothetical protein